MSLYIIHKKYYLYLTLSNIFLSDYHIKNNVMNSIKGISDKILIWNELKKQQHNITDMCSYMLYLYVQDTCYSNGIKVTFLH